MADCKHEFVVVHTTERISQEYDTVASDWMGGVEHFGLISVDKIICDACGENVTGEFKDEIA